MADGAVRVPPRIAQMLDQRVQMLAEQRKMLRDSDAEAYEVLCALYLSRLGHEQNVFPSPRISGSGQGLDASATQQTDSEQLTTPQAAKRLGVSDRTVRRWCESKRLPARWHGGRWHINEHDLRVAQAATAA
ncbi:helix-turn-helix domain-containing protein [Mycobacterium sp. 94-17]|uniref:helix-turn-helix domain-containing protein n=1 Tax=Mycobacterium sp. 94-17 TaxID=2986147 RepID=UPI003B63EA8E